MEILNPASKLAGDEREGQRKETGVYCDVSVRGLSLLLRTLLIPPDCHHPDPLLQNDLTVK